MLSVSAELELITSGKLDGGYGPTGPILRWMSRFVSVCLMADPFFRLSPGGLSEYANGIHSSSLDFKCLH